MKKKKGFVFVETLVVVAVLTTSLLMLYSTYSAVIQKEKTRIKYNDSVYLYRTYYIEKFFRNFRLDIIATRLNNTDPNRYLMLSSFGCSADIFVNEEDNLGMCETLLQDAHVSNLYLAYNDLSKLQTCENQRGICEALVQVNDKTADYLKTIGGAGMEGYRIIVEYSENKDGTRCEGDSCQFYYATISLGVL